MSTAGRGAGFTLLEVLVALAVLATALTGALVLAGRSTTGLARLEAKTWAHWVALNQLVALQLAGAADGARADTGVEDMGGRRWHWTTRLAPAADAQVRRILVEVREAADGAVVTDIVGYVALGGTARP